MPDSHISLIKDLNLESMKHGNRICDCLSIANALTISITIAIMRTFRERLIFARENHPDGRMTQAALAKAAGISQTTVADIERGRNDGSKHVVSLARALKCSVDWLAENKGDIYSQDSTKGHDKRPSGDASISSQQKYAEVRRVPVLTLRQASNWSELVDNFSTKENEQISKHLLTTKEITQHTYGIIVENDSMTSSKDGVSFPEGIEIIIDPEREPQNKQFVIVRQPFADPIFRQLVIEGGKKYLRPLNERWPMAEMHQDAVVCGVAIYWQSGGSLI